MATKNEEKLLIIPSLDGGVQTQTTEFLPQKSEIKKGINIDPTFRLGGIAKALGYNNKGAALVQHTSTTSTSTSTSTSSSTSSSSTSSSSTTTP